MGLRPRRMMRRRRRRARRRIMLAGGMVVFGVQMSQSQAKQIEEHTGVPPEELEDEDLEAAMAEPTFPSRSSRTKTPLQELAPTTSAVQSG